MFNIIPKQQTPKLNDIDDPKKWVKDNSEFLTNFLNFFNSLDGAAGLAANQVEFSESKLRLPFKLAIIQESEDSEPITAINPKIVKTSGELVPRMEGCLTWGDKATVVAERYLDIVVEYMDISGNKQTKHITEEFPAQVWQHEINHLEGINEYVYFQKPETYKAPKKIGRNDPCLCGSGKKYKKCCIDA